MQAWHALLCLAFAVSSSASNVNVNPIRKVVGMLTDMQKELEREGAGEAALFEKTMCACEGGEKDLNKVIDDSTAAIRA